MVAEKIYVNSWSHKEWLQHRINGIGGSEIGIILGLSPYKSTAQLWCEKVGLYPIVKQDNLPMFMGRYMEDTVADLWQYWGGYAESVVENHPKVKLNKSHRVNAYLHNDKYPYLLGSIDRKITMKNLDKRVGILECKTINGFYASKFESGLPPAYVSQVQQYMLITGYDYAEIAMLIDGREMRVFEIPADKEMQELIAKKAKAFWAIVEEARPLVDELFDLELIETTQPIDRIKELKAKLDELEPAPDNSKAYEDFMKERYKTPVDKREGTKEEFTEVINYTALQMRQKSLKGDMQTAKNKLIAIIGNKEMIEFEHGKITYKPNARGVKALRVTTALEE